MAEIFLARLLRDGGFEKLVCIKRILPHLANDPQFVAMFLDEARVVARISHPNACQVFELGAISGQYYIAMEYLAGVPLAAFRRKEDYPGAPDPQLVAGFGMQACEGLHHAHQLKGSTGQQLGVVHRDISPQNLFVTLDGIVKVLDFGIAKVQDQSVRTSTGAVKGTYCYMAPEQLRGERVDRRADVWALGTVLWETLAQKHLFKRDTLFLTFQAIATAPGARALRVATRDARDARRALVVAAAVARRARRGRARCAVVVVMFVMKQDPVAPAVSAAPVASISMVSVPADAVPGHAVVPPDAAPVARPVPAIAKVRQVPERHREPEVLGPPGFITIDSTPVFTGVTALAAGQTHTTVSSIAGATTAAASSRMARSTSKRRRRSSLGSRTSRPSRSATARCTR